jgi:ArsR family transcriptional regulator
MHTQDDAYRAAAQWLRVLSHPARLQIVDELRRGDACVCHLQAALRQSQPYVSQQLRVLRDLGVAETRREGVFVYYHLVDDRADRLLQTFVGPPRGTAARKSCDCPTDDPPASLGPAPQG